MAWGKLTTHTEVGTVDDVTTDSYTSSKFQQVMSHIIGITNVGNYWKMRMSGDTGSVYASRYVWNGGTEYTEINSTSMLVNSTTAVADNNLVVDYVCAIAGEEKLRISNVCANGIGTGAGTAPARFEVVNKFVPSPDSDVTQITFTSADGLQDFATDSNVSVLGSDLTPAAAIPFPANVQVGSRAEITDTRKMYHRDDIDFKEENGNEATNYRSASWYEQLSGETP